MITSKVTADNLDEVMDFGHIIHVHADGTVTDNLPDMFTPEVTMIVDADGQDIHGLDDSYLQDQAGTYGWTLLSGRTGQYGYNGVVMHPSEFIGGRLAEDILAEPGLYVSIIIETEDEEGEQQDTPAGWAIAYKEV